MRTGDHSTPGLAEDAPRTTVLSVHRNLRQQIVSNELAAGSEINQVRLAEHFGTSRGPIREALRLLEQEGLVIATPNQRHRVAPLDPAAVDSACAQRILLESLGLRLTIGRFENDEAEAGQADIRQMIAVADRLSDYMGPHLGFHRRLIRGLPEPLLATVHTLFENTERYRRFYAQTTASSIAIAAEEHGAILAACDSGDVAAATRLLARHYARTSLEVLARFAPEFEPRGIRGALAMASDGPFRNETMR